MDQRHRIEVILRKGCIKEQIKWVIGLTASKLRIEDIIGDKSHDECCSLTGMELNHSYMIDWFDP